MNRVIWWIRRDLRLADNQALAAALAQAEQVVPAFILDPALLGSAYVGPRRLAFLYANLRQLDADLRARGSRLIVRRGSPLAELTRLKRETGAVAIYAQDDYSPYARRRDGQVVEALPLQLQGGLVVHPPGTVLKEDGDPYVVYTPFSRQWRALTPPRSADLLPVPAAIDTPEELESEPIPAEPALPDDYLFPAGEAEAQRRLAAFVDNGRPPPIYAYQEQRNQLDIDGTSQISPYLRFGLVSPRAAAVAAYEARAAAAGESDHKNADVWLSELIWREFYWHILAHFPRVRRRSFYEQYDQIEWVNDEADFEAWRQGQTGYPVVDAAMRQLLATGWMHNRARMIVASFLTKDLLIDWRWGERWFMQQLVDGDPAANNGGWQWTAGTGTDAAPYFRIFNPVSQGKKHDPDGRYVRRWLPELADLPDRYLHEPWTMPDDVQRQVGCRIGQNYPAPIVDHGAARERTLAAYKAARETRT